MATGRNSSEIFRVFDLDTGTGSDLVQGVSLRTEASGGSIPAGTTANPLVVTGGGGGVQVNEDDAHISGVTGTVALGVRQDADTSPVSATNDYHALIFDAAGNLKVNVKAQVAGVIGLTDAELRATAVPVSGPLTDTQLRATAVPVSSTDLDIRNLVFATDKVDVSGSTGVGVTGPLTDAQLRATAVPVSGPLTDAQLRATAVPVSGTVTANPALGFGKTLQFAVIAQGAAGTTELVAAVGGQRIKLVSYVFVMSLAGTVKFRSGAATDISGAMDMATNGGAVVVGTVANPIMQTVSGEALNIVTTLGAARGHISFFTEA